MVTYKDVSKIKFFDAWIKNELDIFPFPYEGKAYGKSPLNAAKEPERFVVWRVTL